MNKLELRIFCDASIKTFTNNGRTFGCAGAVCPEYNLKKFEIMPDSTNNKSEIYAIYLAVQLANEIIKANPDKDYNVVIYSDSKISVFGLKVWMKDWITFSYNGVLYNAQGMRVKNQEIFLMVLAYLESNNLKINLYHIKGHVNIHSQQSIDKARKVFFESNGFNLDNEVLNTISFYNNIVDEGTRYELSKINPDSYPIQPEMNRMVYYVPVNNWTEYIQ